MVKGMFHTDNAFVTHTCKKRKLNEDVPLGKEKQGF